MLCYLEMLHYEIKKSLRLMLYAVFNVLGLILSQNSFSDLILFVQSRVALEQCV